MKTLAAGCKVNLGLTILGRADSGYHLLDSVFYPLDIPGDTLRITPAPRKNSITVNIDDQRIDQRDNTLTRAYAAFSERTGHAPGIAVTLRKGIPLGSGLGGGSSDAAALLKWLNSSAGRPLNPKEMLSLACQVGADVAFFLADGPCRAQGYGEILSPLRYDFSDITLILVCPAVLAGTASVYKEFDRLAPAIQKERLPPQGHLTKAPSTPRRTTPFQAKAVPWSVWDIHNDLETAAFSLYPELASIKDELRDLGAGVACMSGSGSSIFGLFRDKKQATLATNILATRGARRKVYQIPLKCWDVAKG